MNAVVAEAPGRVNLLGEHTDYNDGFVLPMAIPQRTRVTLRRRTERTVVVRSLNLDEERTFEIAREERTGGFVDYVQGVTVAFRRAGHTLSGFDLEVASDVPIGGGLSSSAALMVALARALRTAFSIDIDDLTIARLAHVAETTFVGAPVGLLDQIACSLADESHALFLDTRSLSYERVAFPERLELVIIDSGITHDHASGDYRVRRGECERAAEILGVAKLRDLGETVDLERLPPTLQKRVRHVLTENRRVLDGVIAMLKDDIDTLGRLFLASHASMRDDYEVSTPDVDALVAIAADHPGIVGARMTGGGFGGAVVALARKGEGAAAGERITARFREASGRPARLLVPQHPRHERGKAS
jgi:galactokinase